jgi:anaerobic selenocysteine-containing dehydrogenase
MPTMFCLLLPNSNTDVQGSYGHTDVLLNRPAIEPVGQAKSNSEIFRLLAKAMGFDEPCFSEDDVSLCPYGGWLGN